VLSASQLSAIKIETVGSYAFALEKEAAGKVSFDEDLPITQAEATLIGAAATFELTTKELTRVKGLAGDNGLSVRELEQANSDQQTAASALKAARDSVRALGKTDTEIDRMIARRKISTPISRGRSKWVVAYITENDSPLVHVGQPVLANVMALPDRGFDGKVSRVYADVDADTHRVAMRCEVADPGNELRPGMLVSAVIRVRDPVQATAVPAETLVREGDGSMTVWVTTDRHRFRQKTVKAGLRQDNQVQILTGLQPGELAVTQGGVFLSNLLLAPPSD
jgi:cobalt-zinc-cadmium efflux system membrane fusion protein